MSSKPQQPKKPATGGKAAKDSGKGKDKKEGKDSTTTTTTTTTAAAAAGEVVLPATARATGAGATGGEKDMADFVKGLLDEMHSRFLGAWRRDACVFTFTGVLGDDGPTPDGLDAPTHTEMSDSIATKIDSFSSRITDLEGQIQDLMKDSLEGAGAGAEAQPLGEEPALVAAGNVGAGEGSTA